MENELKILNNYDFELISIDRNKVEFIGLKKKVEIPIEKIESLNVKGNKTMIDLANNEIHIWNLAEGITCSAEKSLNNKYWIWCKVIPSPGD